MSHAVSEAYPFLSSTTVSCVTVKAVFYSERTIAGHSLSKESAKPIP